MIIILIVVKHNHKNTNVIFESMDKIDFTPYINNVDLFTGGVPCQSYFLQILLLCLYYLLK
jgi:site-specific DNA-cytosine methylase